MNTIIEKIRAEVNRRIKSWSTRGENSPEGQGKDTCVSRVTELTDLLSFLDTLQEQPVCEGLEDVADTLAEEHGFVKKPNFKPAKYSWSAVRDVFIEGVIAGAKWQKEQVLKDGLDKIVHLEWGKKKIEVYDAELEGLKFGDKVKLIIIKEG